MTSMPSRARRFSSAIGDDAVRFGDRILICPRPRHGGRRVDERLHLDFSAGARADLPAPYAEVWVVLSGTLRVGTESDVVTVGAGDFVHVQEQTAGVVEALEDTTMVCVSVPPH